MKHYSVLGVNAGIGPALFPFKEHLIGAIETRSVFHTIGNEQWKENFGDISLHKKMDYTLLEQERYIFNDDTYSITAIISSPDCGAGSVFRLSRAKKFGDHKKSKTLMEFFVALRTCRPKFFLFENLFGLWKSFPKERFIDLTNRYKLITFNNKSVSKWGNSQHSRKRLVIIGIRRDLPKEIWDYFRKPKKMVKRQKTGRLLKNLPKNGDVREDINNPIAIYGGRSMTPYELFQEWNNRLYNKSRFIVFPEDGKKFKTAPGVYRNLANRFPSTARKANRQFNPEGYMMSPRELARIMGVPDTFKIYIDLNKKLYWINKARTCITKGMVYEIPLWFKQCLEKCYELWK